ncbi:MAG TPA: hypothetical protein VMS84_14260 [Mycobacterium sp.]|nr:hypothetical protein [Mycobacterium sp.]
MTTRPPEFADKRCAECGAIKLPDDRREWGYGFTNLQADRPGRFYVCPDCAEGAKQN